MIKDSFQKLGFTSAQAEIYTVLAELGEAKIGEIITKTGFHRNLVIRGVEYLIEKKLVKRREKDGIAYYTMVLPTSLIEEFQHKRKTAENIAQLLNKQQPNQPDILTFRGSSGVIESCNIDFEGTHDIYLLGLNYSFQTTYKEAYDKFQERIIRKGVKRYVLAQPHYRGQKFESMMKNSEIRYLPKNFPKSPLVIAIYYDSIGLYMWEEVPLIIFIRSKDIAQGYKHYFQLLWKQATI